MGISRKPLLRVSDLRPRTQGDVVSALRDGGSSIQFYNAGRTALSQGLREQFGENASGTALLPSYICSAAMPPFHESGLDVEFYDVAPDTEPDVEDLASRVTEETVAVLTVDYFGFPSRRFDEIDRLSQEEDLVHIEDNAHSVFSRSGSELLGTRGDWGIGSLHKLLPVPDGGVLFTPEESGGPPAAPPRTSDLDFLVRTAIKRIDSRLLDGSVVQWINDRSRNGRDGYLDGDDYMDGSSDGGLAVEGMSALTGRVLRATDPERIVERRRQNYAAAADVIAHVPGVEALFPDLDPGVCPLFFPVLAESPEAVTGRLQAVNVPVRPWPFLPGEVRGDDEYATANRLSKQVLTIPIHQHVDRFELVEKLQTLETRRTAATGSQIPVTRP